jgi:hypothetical protein
MLDGDGKAGLWHLWQKPSSRALQKHVTCPHFLATKKIWSPSDIPPLSNNNQLTTTKKIWSPLNTPTPLDGNQKF